MEMGTATTLPVMVDAVLFEEMMVSLLDESVSVEELRDNEYAESEPEKGDDGGIVDFWPAFLTEATW